MTAFATLALVTAVLALLTSVLTWSLSRSPGWSGLRWFSGISLGAACFALGNSVVTLTVSDDVLRLSCRLGLFGAALFVFACPPFCADLERRALSRVDRGFMTVAALWAVLIPIPGLVFTSGIEARTVGTSLGTLSYREPLGGPLEGASLVTFAACALWYAVSLVRRVPGAQRGSGVLGHGLALLLLALCIVNDCLVSAGVIPGVYLVLVAFLSQVVASGTLISRRVGQGARALERLTAELARTEASLVRRERMAALGAIAAGVSEQVRAPLDVLDQAIQSLRQRLREDPEANELLSISAEESGRIGRLVSELSDFASPRAPEFSVQVLEEVVASAVRAALMGAGLEECGAQLHLEPAGRRIRCDPDLLHQAVVNLVSNALQARGRRRPVEIRVHWERDPTRAIIEVQDDGAGLPPELHRQIFEPFFTTRATGAGLGLSLVQRVAVVHGGSVSVDSRPEAGARFVLTVPEEGAHGGATTPSLTHVA